MPINKGRLAPLTASFVFVLGFGCSGTAPHDVAPPITIATTSPSTAPSSTAPDPAENASQATTSAPNLLNNRCASDGAFPRLAREPQAAAPLPCRAAEVAAEKTLTTDMKARYQPRMAKSTVEIKFGCDGLDKVISRIVLENGGGHAGSLSIIEISRADPTAVMYDVIGVRLSASMLTRPKSPFEIVRTTISQEAVFAWMPLVRAALRTTIEEIEPKPTPNTSSGSGSIFGSSSNFHILIRAEDASARVMEGSFTGYENSFGQAQYLPLQRAREEVDPSVAGLTWHVETPPEDVKRFFDRRFVDAQKRFSDSSAWWVRERYMKLAAHVGSRALIPSLLPFLTPSTKDPSDARMRDYAFEALVALTGWDPRAPKNGEHPRTIESAANEFVTECGKVPVAR